MDTIFALASGSGKAGVAVIRVSGPQAATVALRLSGANPRERYASLRPLVDRDGVKIDDALVLFFRGPKSFTGEDVLELQVHGSVAVCTKLLKTLATIEDCRHAEPGEFTRRALENGRLDLASVEGLADLIDAETEAQRAQAIRLMDGALGALVDTWRARLLTALALIEVTIDFADEEVPVDVWDDVEAEISATKNEIISQIAGSQAAQRIRVGFEVALIGKPNVGKSTLLNAIAGREVAITSDIAGTTRDTVEAHVDLNGLKVTLVDTAGLRETEDALEGLGIERAISRANSADLRIFLLEDGEPPDLFKRGDIIVHAKCDLLRKEGFGVSGKTGEGVGRLLDEIRERFAEQASGASLAVNERTQTAMSTAVAGLDRVMDAKDSGAELVADELRRAIGSLEVLVGRITPDDVLDSVFSRFCLGK